MFHPIRNLADHKRFVYSPGRSVSLRPLRRRTKRSRRSRGLVPHGPGLVCRGAPAGQHPMAPSVTSPVTLRDNRFKNTIKQTGQQNIFLSNPSKRNHFFVGSIPIRGATLSSCRKDKYPNREILPTSTTAHYGQDSRPRPRAYPGTLKLRHRPSP